MTNPFAPKLHLSEHFDSIQGEGNHAGYPAIFWRFKGCVLACVFCDTIEVWKQGTAYTYEDLYSLFANAGYFTLLNESKRILVITGGDPLLQQDRLAAFFEYCAARGERVGNWRMEVETQGSLIPKAPFSDYISQWNVSPKLINSGMSAERRIVPTVIEWLSAHHSIYKFPVSDESDMPEVLDYVKTYGIQASRVWLMPISSTRRAHEEVGREVIKLAMKHGFRFSPRLQLVMWDLTTGV